MPESSILLIRHGESTWNAENRWQGLANPPLSDRGREQAEQAAASLAAFRFAGVFSSDLQRARQTAEVLAEVLDLGLSKIDPDLRERDVGDFEGLTWKEIEERWPDLAEKRRAGHIVHPVNSDNEGYEERAMGVIRRLTEEAEARGAPILVVTHSAFIRTIERELGGPPFRSPNLCGIWITATNGKLALGERFVPTDVNVGPPTSVT